MAESDDDLSFDSGPARPPTPAPPPAEPPWAVIAIVALLVALGGVWYFAARSRKEPPPPPSRPVTETTVDLSHRRPGEPGEAIDLPPLDQTDALVRTLVGRLSSHPVVAAWLTTDGLVRNMTVVVSNIADGETPAKFLRPLRPAGAFQTKTANGVTYVDPASYQRYDAIAAAVDGLDARSVARFYATIKPRIDDAYHELIGPDANFDRTLERAIVLLLKTPVPEGDVQVRTGKMSYAYANASLEELPKAQRQFLRMGPRNMRIVKAKLRAVAGFLGIPDAALPPPDVVK
jgi:Protein of unknown function (DUF3014)